MRLVRSFLALLGGAALVIAPCFPTTIYAFGGEPPQYAVQSYFDDDTGGCLLMILVGTIVLVLAFGQGARALRWVSVAGATLVCVSVLLEWTPIQVVQAMARGFEPGALDLGSRIGNGPTVFPGWGYGVYLAAAVLLTVVALMRGVPQRGTPRLHAVGA
jgi:hypothetical protein